MRDASRRAMRPPDKGGLPNALFVVAAAESLPSELTSVADEVTVHFPWGSLLAGVLAADGPVVAGLSQLARPAASVCLLFSVVRRDRVGAAIDIDRMRAGFANHGLCVVRAREATPADIAAAHSSWAKRLRAPHHRAAWFLELEHR